jgi:hypothetical protein
MRNWGAQEHEVSEGVHRPLSAFAITFQQPTKGLPFVLAVLDLGWWRAPQHEWHVRGAILAELGLSPEQLMLHLVHTHAGPSLDPDESHLPGGDLVSPYLETVIQRVCTAVRNALASAQPSTVEFSQGWCGLAQRRDVRLADGRWAVGADPSQRANTIVTVGRITGKAGLRGTLLHYRCHPTTLAWENRLISPDYVGAAREVVAQQTGAPCVALHGWSGDQGPAAGFSGDGELADANGHQLGYAAMEVLSGMSARDRAPTGLQVVESGALIARGLPEKVPAQSVIQIQKQTLWARCRPLAAPAELERAVHAANDPAQQERLRRKQKLSEWVAGRETIPIDLSLARLGDVVLAGVPGEMASAALEEESVGKPGHLLLDLNLVNGWLGYFPPDWCYRERTYSAQAALVEPGTQSMVCGEVQRFLDQAE